MHSLSCLNVRPWRYTVCHKTLAMARRVTTGRGNKPENEQPPNCHKYRTGVSSPLTLFEQKQFCRQSGYELSSIETILILHMFHQGDMLFYCVMEGNKCHLKHLNPFEECSTWGRGDDLSLWYCGWIDFVKVVLYSRRVVDSCPWIIRIWGSISAERTKSWRRTLDGTILKELLVFNEDLVISYISQSRSRCHLV